MTMGVDTTATYLEHRGLLFSIAYRMTGSVQDAEDITSEVFLRYRRALESGTAIETPRAFLATTATRLAIDHLRSAHHNRETYLGPWLPEPLVASTEPDAADRVEMADSLSMAFLVVLESLTPWNAPRSCCARCSSTTTPTSPRSSASPRRTADSSSGTEPAHRRRQAAVRGVRGCARPDRAHLFQRSREGRSGSSRRRARRRRGGLRRRRWRRALAPPAGARARPRPAPHAGAVHDGARRAPALRTVHRERPTGRDRARRSRLAPERDGDRHRRWSGADGAIDHQPREAPTPRPVARSTRC